MDNSIFYLNELVKSLMSDIEAYQDALRMHAITIPREKLEEAVRYGFPEDIYSYYMNTYYVKNEAAAEGVINFIKKDFIPYLQNVSFHLQEAMNVGPGGTAAASVLSNPSSASKPQVGKHSLSSEELAFRTQQLMKKAEAQEKSYKELEKTLGIKRVPRMSIAEADKQNANPHYLEGDEFGINCATCANAYALRLVGFNVKAKGNTLENESLNYWMSHGSNCFKLWKNIDGSPAQPTFINEWMRKKNYTEMTPNRYEEFFEEECGKEGVYIMTIGWKRGGGHATILQRDKTGLFRIEPQQYAKAISDDEGRRKVSDLVSLLRTAPPSNSAILRVDDKVFDTDKKSFYVHDGVDKDGNPIPLELICDDNKGKAGKVIETTFAALFEI